MTIVPLTVAGCDRLCALAKSIAIAPRLTAVQSTTAVLSIVPLNVKIKVLASRSSVDDDSVGCAPEYYY